MCVEIGWFGEMEVEGVYAFIDLYHRTESVILCVFRGEVSVLVVSCTLLNDKRGFDERRRAVGALLFILGTTSLR